MGCRFIRAMRTFVDKWCCEHQRACPWAAVGLKMGRRTLITDRRTSEHRAGNKGLNPHGGGVVMSDTMNKYIRLRTALERHRSGAKRMSRSAFRAAQAEVRKIRVEVETREETEQVSNMSSWWMRAKDSKKSAS